MTGSPFASSGNPFRAREQLRPFLEKREEHALKTYHSFFTDIITMNINTLQFVDLGLPSGKLWATENVKNEKSDEGHFTFDEAVGTFGKNLPSKEDWKELFDNSSYSWNEERKGYDVTGSNGNSIFLPAAGYRYGASVYYVGIGGLYWSSSVLNENNAFHVLFLNGTWHPQNSSYRYYGFSVRLVR